MPGARETYSGVVCPGRETSSDVLAAKTRTSAFGSATNEIPPFATPGTLGTAAGETRGVAGETGGAGRGACGSSRREQKSSEASTTTAAPAAMPHLMRPLGPRALCPGVRLSLIHISEP